MTDFNNYDQALAYLAGLEISPEELYQYQTALDLVEYASDNDTISEDKDWLGIVQQSMADTACEERESFIEGVTRFIVGLCPELNPNPQ